MNLSARTLIVSIVTGLFATAAYASPPTVNPEPMDLDVATTATIMKEKSKRSNMIPGGSSDSSTPGGASNCGTVNINSNDKTSNSGIKDMFGKQQTTVITGPVINMANCK